MQSLDIFWTEFSFEDNLSDLQQVLIQKVFQPSINFKKNLLRPFSNLSDVRSYLFEIFSGNFLHGDLFANFTQIPLRLCHLYTFCEVQCSVVCIWHKCFFHNFHYHCYCYCYCNHYYLSSAGGRGGGQRVFLHKWPRSRCRWNTRCRTKANTTLVCSMCSCVSLFVILLIWILILGILFIFIFCETF